MYSVGKSFAPTVPMFGGLIWLGHKLRRICGLKDVQNSCFVRSRFCIRKILTLHKFFRLDFEVAKRRRQSCLEKRQSEPKLLPEQQLVFGLLFYSEC